MSKVALTFLILVGLVIGGLGMSWWMKPPPAAAGPLPSPQIAYICRETGTLSFGPRQPTPAVNPATGRSTLVQALFCPQCEKWHAAPPPEFSERLPLGPVCPVHKLPLLETEPTPAATDTPTQ
ncbi:MAG: hypothetical protein ACKV0T_14970 [Planctomycetales bacterium]